MFCVVCPVPNASRLRQNISINGVKLAQRQGLSRHRPGPSTRSNFRFDSSGAPHSKLVPFPRSVLSPIQNRSSAVDTDASLREKELRDLLSTHSKDGPDYYDESNSDDEVLGDWLEGKTLLEAAAEINVTDEMFVLEDSRVLIALLFLFGLIRLVPSQRER